MSVDTTVVIAGRRHPYDGRMQYTAAVVQCAENLFGTDAQHALSVAQAYFCVPGQPWFTSFGRAKQFANLIADEERDQGSLEYEHRPIIEIGPDRIYLLSKKGRRLGPASAFSFDRPPTISRNGSARESERM